MVSKQKVNISVSDNLHFINLSLAYKHLRLILYWNSWSFVLSNVSKGIEYTIIQSSCDIVFPIFCCNFSCDYYDFFFFYVQILFQKTIDKLVYMGFTQ